MNKEISKGQYVIVRVRVKNGRYDMHLLITGIDYETAESWWMQW